MSEINVNLRRAQGQSGPRLDPTNPVMRNRGLAGPQSVPDSFGNLSDLRFPGNVGISRTRIQRVEAVEKKQEGLQKQIGQNFEAINKGTMVYVKDGPLAWHYLHGQEAKAELFKRNYELEREIVRLDIEEIKRLIQETSDETKKAQLHKYLEATQKQLQAIDLCEKEKISELSYDLGQNQIHMAAILRRVETSPIDSYEKIEAQLKLIEKQLELLEKKKEIFRSLGMEAEAKLIEKNIENIQRGKEKLNEKLVQLGSNLHSMGFEDPKFKQHHDAYWVKLNETRKFQRSSLDANVKNLEKLSTGTPREKELILLSKQYAEAVKRLQECSLNEVALKEIIELQEKIDKYFKQQDSQGKPYRVLVSPNGLNFGKGIKYSTTINLNSEFSAQLHSHMELCRSVLQEQLKEIPRGIEAVNHAATRLLPRLEVILDLIKDTNVFMAL